MRRSSKLPHPSEREIKLSSFLSEAALSYPDYIDAVSAWTEHVPFAFWLIQALGPDCFVELGTHSGVSYLAFCQAIKAVALPTHAYAIDTWRGDEHSGYYGEEVFDKLRGVHDPRYSSFSRLVRTTFDEAAGHFSDDSIDLLHIDGLHTYEAVKHDFETWGPKLAPRSIVLFHDTNVRERGFGVWKLWRELAESHPHFEFLHGHGLGVLGVGTGFPSALTDLFAATYDARAEKYIRDLFSRLGGYIASKVVVDQLRATVADDRSVIDRMSAEVVARDARITELLSAIATHERRSRDLSTELAARDARIAELSADIIAHEGRSRDLSTELAARDARIAELSADIIAHEGRSRDLSTELAARDARIAELSADIIAHEGRSRDLSTELAARDARIAELSADIIAHEGRSRDLSTELAARDARIGTMKKSLSWRLTRPLRWKIPRKPRKKLKQVWKPSHTPVEVPPEQPAAEIATLLPPTATVEPNVATPRAHSLSKRPCVVFLSGEPNTPGHYYRVENICSALAPRYFERIIIRNDELSERVNECAGADLLWIWRMCWTEPVARAVELARGNNARVVFDVDDLMFRPDVANTEIIDGIRSQCMSEEMVAQGFSLMRHTLAHADHATAPTETLAHELRCAFKPASVIPNGFDRHTLALARTLCHVQRKAGDDGWLRIGYASGSLTHQRDLAVASGAIADVLLAYPRVRLVLFEHAIDIAEFPELAPFTDRIEWRPLVPVRELPKEYARFDISIAPLEVGNVFCEAKSELKFFEPVLCGVVTVASPTRPFREAIRHGETGFLAAGRDEWRKYLQMLITDPDLRRRVADAALADVLVRHGPERRIALVNRLLTKLLAPPPIAGEVARNSLLEPQPAAKRIDTEFDIVYASPHRGVSRVGVVVPLYNYAQYVREALDSVAAQTVRELDVIVVDDCSTDNSLNVAKTWLIANQHKFNHVALLQNKRNAKLSRTRNAGICYADAELVLPLDADNQLLPSCVERCIALLDETNAALAYPTIEMFGDRAGLITEHDWDASRLQFGNYIDAMAMFRKACWLTVGGYSPIEHGWEDYDLWCKFVEAGFWAVRVPEVTARYRVHGQSMLQTVTEVAENRERTVDDLTHRHPWLDILPPSPALSAEPEQLTATPVRLASPCVAVNPRLACEALLPLLQCPETREPLDRVGDELRSIHSGRRWPIVDGRPVFTKEGRDVHRHSSEHVSNPLPKQAIDLIEGTKGPVLNLSGGATSHSFEHVCEAEYSLFRTTDVAADAHCLPFKDEIFDMVISLNAFEHYRDPRTVTNEIRRVLRPGGKLFIHTAFMQPLHEAPHHYFNCTKYGLREWLHQFEIERISVSDNLNPAYAFSWLASEIGSAFATCVSEKAAEDFLSAPVGSFVAFWRDEGLRHSPLWQAFFQLPEDVQERFAAGWEALAYRRAPTAI